ncbi:MAG: cobyrinate a,c-diamide synthase [Methylophilus sp.]|nr:cobyrinate a,c-diamide synthase [Methylophilus sp.]
MSARTCPAVLVSAPASGQGKTLVTAALARAWRNRGLTVQAFKCGPDFIDSMILQVATGRPVYNLDLGMCGVADAQSQLYHAAQQADVIIAEGVMGLYDGTPSTADIAKAFNLPVALVIDASGMAQTFAAVAHGLYDFEPSLLRAGVVANKVGSAGHASMLKEAISNHSKQSPTGNDATPWLGALLKDAQLSLPERHLGLHLAHEISDIEQRIEAAAQMLGDDLPLPPTVRFAAPEVQGLPRLLEGKTIAVARDAAFCFIYPANIDCLKALGANVIYFSALDDVALPEADAYWIPGGYPELHLERIQQNIQMQVSLKAAKQDGKPILAECGGMMALGQRINGSPTFDVIAGESTMQTKLQGLGTQHVTTPLGTIGAHTFHYGQFQSSLTPAHVANSKYRQGEAVYVDGSVTASFLHFYFPSNPVMAAQFFLS